MSLSKEKNHNLEVKEEPEVHQDLSILRHVPIFRGLDPDCLKLLSMLCRREKYFSGDQLVDKAEDNDRAFFIISGEVKALYLKGEKEQVARYFCADQVICSSSLLAKVPSIFSLQANETTEVLSIARDDFLRALEKFPGSFNHVAVNYITEVFNWDQNMLNEFRKGGEREQLPCGVSLL